MDAMLTSPQGRILLGSAALAVGRAQDNQLVIRDAKVSAHHAEIRLAKHGHSIIDLESTNGTFLNEQRLAPNKPYQLKPLDVIRLGGATFVYEVGKVSINAPSFYAAPPVDQNPGNQTTVTAPFTPIPAANVEVMPGHRAYQQQRPFPAYTQSQRSIHTPLPGILKKSNYAPPTPILQQHRQRRKVAFAITCGIVLFAVIGFALLAFVIFDMLSGPSSTLNAYCNALKNQNYQAAYQQLDTSSQRKFSLSDFTRYVSDNNGAGRVIGCVVSDVNATDSRGSGTINYTYTSGGTRSIGYTLSSGGNSWRIASVVVSTPDMTLRIYCDALNKHDYPVAYSQFSTGFKSALSEPEFADRFNAAGINSCQASAMQKDGPIVTSIITYGDVKGNVIIFNAHLINDNGVWKIDTQQA